MLGCRFALGFVWVCHGLCGFGLAWVSLGGCRHGFLLVVGVGFGGWNGGGMVVGIVIMVVVAS